MSTALSRRRDEWDRIVTMWLHGRPESTQSVYRPVIDDFRGGLEGRSIGQVTLEDLQHYADKWPKQKARTVTRKLATIRSLLSFCHKTGLIRINVGPALHMPAIPEDLAQKILEPEEIQRLIKADPDPRNQVMMRVMYGSGIRSSEVSGLRWGHIQPRGDAGQITVTGKGSKSRTLKLSAPVWKALLSIRPAQPAANDPVFARSDGRPLDRTTISKIVGNAARAAGIKLNVSAHWLRHGHATHALDRGAKLSLIQHCLGHTSLTATSRYLHIRPDESSSAYVDA